MLDIQLLTVESVYSVHKQAIDLYGGLDGVFNNTYDKIESIISQQYPVFGYDKYPNIYQKAAMVLYFFSKDHCFIDGNKRIAIMCTILLLNINGYKSLLTNDEGYNKTLEISQSKISENDRDEYIDRIAGWLCENFVRE